MTPVQLTEKYLELRLANKVPELLALCAETIEVQTTKPYVGTTVIKGKFGVEGYLMANPGEGTWEPVQELSDDTTRVNGRIEYAQGDLVFNAEATFTTANGLITKVVVNFTVL